MVDRQVKLRPMLQSCLHRRRGGPAIVTILVAE
jgi:hypothetical protein